jgi:hypothetical protein
MISGSTLSYCDKDPAQQGAAYGRAATRRSARETLNAGLQLSPQVQTVENKSGCKGENQNQYQRFDAHAVAPKDLLYVGDIGTIKPPANVTALKYLPSVAKISQIGC